MNLPNKLTILRALMVPVFVFFILYPAEQEMLFRLIALFLFVQPLLQTIWTDISQEKEIWLPISVNLWTPWLINYWFVQH